MLPCEKGSKYQTENVGRVWPIEKKSVMHLLHWLINICQIDNLQCLLQIATRPCWLVYLNLIVARGKKLWLESCAQVERTIYRCHSSYYLVGWGKREKNLPRRCGHHFLLHAARSMCAFRYRPTSPSVCSEQHALSVMGHCKMLRKAVAWEIYSDVEATYSTQYEHVAISPTVSFTQCHRPHYIFLGCWLYIPPVIEVGKSIIDAWLLVILPFNWMSYGWASGI
jgi:hypothetical protein